MSWFLRFSSRGAITLGSMVAMINYYLVVLFAGISYDVHMLRNATPDRPYGGGPATMMAGFLGAPAATLVLTPVTYLLLRWLSTREHHVAASAVVLGHLALFLLIVIFLA